MSELSMHELEAQTGEVLPEREALSVGFAIGSFNHRTTINHNTTHVTTTSITASNASSAAVTNSVASSATSSAGQSISVHG